MVAVSERPWRQLPGTSFAACNDESKALRGGPNGALGEYSVAAQDVDTVFETEVGLQAAEGSGAAVQNEARRCYAFSPEADGSQQDAAPPLFRPCMRCSHVPLRRAAAEPSVPSGMHQWGFIGALLAYLFDGTTEGWVRLESWIISFLTTLWHVLASLFLWRPSAQSEGSRSASEEAVPSMQWHPHRDMMASVSARGEVAVHSLGDPFGGPTTQYLHDDAAAGRVLALAWQPNDLRGTLALGMSHGVSLWRRSWSDGWWLAWSVQGEVLASAAIAWAPDGRCVASGSLGGVVRIWHHGDVCTQQSDSHCITLRRWRRGRVADLQWGPNGAFLAVAHEQGSISPTMIRVWDTRTWEISAFVNLGAAGASRPGVSLNWCSGDTLLASHSGASGQGCIFEFFGIYAKGAGGAANSEPISRALPLPSVRAVDGADDPVCPSTVMQVAVCPRTAQRIAVRLAGVAHVLVFERLGMHGWAKQELSFRGAISATSRGTSPTPLPVALAFASAPATTSNGGASRGGTGGPPEGSLLAIYWDFGDSVEIRTYPMHFLPHKLMQHDNSVLFN